MSLTAKEALEYSKRFTYDYGIALGRIYENIAVLAKKGFVDYTYMVNMFEETEQVINDLRSSGYTVTLTPATGVCFVKAEWANPR